MNGTLAIAARELRSTFATAAGWVVMALLLLVCGIVFSVSTLREGEPASLRAVLEAAGWALLFIAPALSMRSIAEELRLGTFETLAAAPVGEEAIVAGKFLGALAALAVMLAPTALLGLALELHGRPDWGEIACGYLGLLLAGGLFLAAGILASTLTSSQLVAYLLALFFWLTVALCARLLPPLAPAAAAELLYAADPLRRLGEFTIGLLDSANVAAFAAFALAFLGAASISLRIRRWA